MNMFCYFVILLLAISSKAASQCDYIYVAEPPNGQLILCDPFAIDQLRLVCSIYVDNFSQNDVLRIQWFFSAPINFQFNPTNAQLLREVSFDVTTSETFTSRIVVGTPPVGFYYCQPQLDSGRPLLRSNIAILQFPSFYQQRNIRSCRETDYHINTTPSCAQPGLVLDPNQLIPPAPTATEIIQFASPTAVNVIPTPTMPFVVKESPVCNVTATAAATQNLAMNPGFIAGVVIGSVFTIIIGISCFMIILLQAKKRKVDKKLQKSYSDIRIHALSDGGNRYAATPATDQDENSSESPYVPPDKPPPKLHRFTISSDRIPRSSSSHHYNRLNFPKMGKKKAHQRSSRSASESTAYYIIPEHASTNGPGAQYYVDFNEDNGPYVDGSESLVYTDSQYSTESDLHLMQPEKEHGFVRSSSLDLKADKRARARDVGKGKEKGYKYQNVSIKTKNVSVDGNDTVGEDEETLGREDLGTVYHNADILEESAAV